MFGLAGDRAVGKPQVRTAEKGMGVSLSTASRPGTAMPMAVLHDGFRFSGDSVGQRARKEMDQAVKGRQDLGSDWRAPKDTVLRREFLEGDLHTLEMARAGRTEEIRDASWKSMLEDVSRRRDDPHVERIPEVEDGSIIGQRVAIDMGARHSGAGFVRYEEAARRPGGVTAQAAGLSTAADRGLGVGTTERMGSNASAKSMSKGPEHGPVFLATQSAFISGGRTGRG